MILLLTAAAFLSGALMFSYWLGKLARRDLRIVGDGNPGAYNLWKAAGYKWGMAGVALDFLKGYLPVFFIVKSGIVQDFGIVPVAAAPVAGHAFSPFMKGKGGKTVAVTFGVWSALTQFEISLVYALLLACMLLIMRAIRRGKPNSSEADGLMVVLGLMLSGVYLFAKNFPLPILCVWAVNVVIMAYANKEKLAHFLPSK